MTLENVRLANNSTSNMDLCVMLITSSDCHNVYKHVHHVNVYKTEILHRIMNY